jgi:hypothetical protein
MSGPVPDGEPPVDDDPAGEPPPDAEPLATPDVEPAGELPPEAEPLATPDIEPSWEPPSVPALETLPPHDAPAIATRPRRIAASFRGLAANAASRFMQPEDGRLA